MGRFRETFGMSEPTAANNPKPRFYWLVGKNPRNTFIRVAVLVVVCFILFFSHLVLLPVKVSGISMLPTYKDRSFNLVNRLAYLRHEPQRGDVVCVRAYAGLHLMLIKRVIGLPGETVEFDHGRVLINGKPLDEPYEKWESDWTIPPKKLSMDEYFIVGDNRTMRWQDHTFGKVERSRIIGKILL